MLLLAAAGCATPRPAPPDGPTAVYGQAWCDAYVKGAQWQYCAVAAVADDKACRGAGSEPVWAAYNACRADALWQRRASPWEVAVVGPCRLPDGTMVRDSLESCRTLSEAFMKE
jgi:hypothetical protein